MQPCWKGLQGFDDPARGLAEALGPGQKALGNRGVPALGEDLVLVHFLWEQERKADCLRFC